MRNYSFIFKNIEERLLYQGANGSLKNATLKSFGKEQAGLRGSVNL
jgi:hypothetical protein